MKTKLAPKQPAKELRVSCRAPVEIVNQISRIASATGVSESDVVRMALKRYLPEMEKQAA